MGENPSLSDVSEMAERINDHDDAWLAIQQRRPKQSLLATIPIGNTARHPTEDPEGALTVKSRCASAWMRS
jgi:hypothetical protein